MKKSFWAIALFVVLTIVSSCVAVRSTIPATPAESAVTTEAVTAEVVTGEAISATEAVDVAQAVSSTEAVSATEEVSAAVKSAPIIEASSATTIVLGDAITIEGAGAAVSESGVLINAAGTYVVSGTLADGMVEVNAPGAQVEIVLAGASITNSEGPAILFAEIEQAVVTLQAGTENFLADGGSSEFDAALYSYGTLTLGGEGALNVTATYEGISSVMHIIMNSGTIRVYANEDGLNANNDGISEITINGGYLYVETEVGDGIDSNGTININGGTVISLGALADMNGGIDADGDVTITGGTVIATGAMLSMPVSTSPQKSLYVSFNGTQAAGTLFSIQADGGQLLTFAPAIDYQSFLYSSGSVAEGVSYDVYSGGSVTGEAVDGLTVEGEVSVGTLFSTITTDSVLSGGRPGPRR